MERSLRIDVYTRDIRLLPDIFGRSITVGQQAEIAEGVSIRSAGTEEVRAVDVPAILHFTLEFGERATEAVGTGVIAAWLYDKVKGRIHPERGGEKLVIERTEVELEEGAIKRVLTEKLDWETKE
jgi:diaminopimelate epimerase